MNRVLGLAAALFLLAVGQTGVAGRYRPIIEPPPLVRISDAEREVYLEGLLAFKKDWGLTSKLGPRFNHRSCIHCHKQPQIGGTGDHYLSNVLFGRNVSGVYDPLTALGGPMLPLHSNQPREIPDAANVMSLRKIPRLFGLGLVEAVPDSELLGLAAANGGRAVVAPDGRVQRFGSQNQMGTLLEFVNDALETELGVTPDERPAELPAQIRDFLLLVAPPGRGDVDAAAAAGEQVFSDIGCDRCHVPSLRTHDGPFEVDGETIDIQALQGATFAPYSDFLLHDLGGVLDDGVSVGEAESWEYRTAPLWGMRFDTGTLLHDGRASAFDQAIHLHGGEAKESRAAFLALGKSERQQLIKFLRTL